MLRTLVLSLAILLSYGAIQSVPAPEPIIKLQQMPSADPIERLTAVSGMVKSNIGSGSCVIFRNGENYYAWTAAHVVEGCTTPSGKFDTVYVLRDKYQNNKHCGYETLDATVIRYDLREDTALLKIEAKELGEGCEFLEVGKTPNRGDALWHVGSMGGFPGLNSLSDGIFSYAGRYRLDFVYSTSADAKVYDQITLPGWPGSSGGGVFLKSNGKCIGLLTQRAIDSRSESINLIVPTRRLWEFAERTDCRWAIDASVKVPEKDGEYK